MSRRCEAWIVQLEIIEGGMKSQKPLYSYGYRAKQESYFLIEIQYAVSQFLQYSLEVNDQNTVKIIYYHSNMICRLLPKDQISKFWASITNPDFMIFIQIQKKATIIWYAYENPISVYLYKLVMTVGVEQKMVLYESCTRMSAPPSNNHMLLVLPHHDRSPPLEIACDKMLLRRQKI